MDVPNVKLSSSSPTLSKFNPRLASWSKKDFTFFFVLIPALLTLVYILPQTIKDNFILHAENPTAWSLFFSNYTHTAFPHLENNLAGYLIVMFLLFNIETDKKFFYKTAFLIFTVLPIAVSTLVIYLLPKLPPIQGFSAIVSGFMGYLLYAAYNHVRKVYNANTDISFLYLLLTANFATLTFSGKYIALPIALLIIGAYQLRHNWALIKELSKQIYLKYKGIPKKNHFEYGYKTAVFLLLVAFVFSLATLIPSNIISGTTITNTPAHYFGYVFGVFAPIIIEKKKNV